MPNTFPPLQFLNREVALLEFNLRVFAQAEDDTIPLLERLKYLCIVSSNLDEFFEVRVAGLMEQIKHGGLTTNADGMTAIQTLNLVREQAHQLIKRQYQLFNEKLTPALAAQGIKFLRRTHWSEAQQAWVKDYFFREVMPVLTPIGLDPAHPFPRVLNKSLNFAVELQGRDAFGRNSARAIVQAPRVLPRTIPIPREISGCEHGFVFLSSIMHAHVDELFSGMEVLGCYQFRATRNSNLFVDDEEVKNLRLSLQGELPQRNFGDAVRLEIADNCSPEVEELLRREFKLTANDVFRVHGPVNLVRLMEIPGMVDRDDLKFPAFVPGVPLVLQKKGADMFKVIRKGDILLHHPYQSFRPVIDFIQQAASDPNVVAIKQTVYRTGTDSALMEALVNAARHGTEVTVVVELLARFDEEANINWATRLEEVGAHVVYGVVGHKTHAKMLMVVRREDGKLRRYVHLGTGNYHPRTARLYTDFGLFTSNEGNLRRRERNVQPAHRPRQSAQTQSLVAIALLDAQRSAARHQKRDIACQGGQARAHHRQDECPARTANHHCVVRGFAGGGESRFNRARGVCTTTRRSRTIREYPRALHHRTFSGAHPHLLFPQRLKT